MPEFYPDSDPDWLKRYSGRRIDDANTYILKHPGDVIVAEQIHCYPRASIKFPAWHKPGMTYSRLALEQSSGELAARHKAQLLARLSAHSPAAPGLQDPSAIESPSIHPPYSIADLTGGLGMDTLAFAQHAHHVYYADPARHPLELARNNHRQHQLHNITYFNLPAEEALDKIPPVDWIFLDPSRRNPQQRVFLLRDCEPDVLSLLPQLQKKCKGILLKLSPLYDLRALLREIPAISLVEVVSVAGEVKEILALLHSADFNQEDDILRTPAITANPIIKATCLPADYSLATTRYEKSASLMGAIPEIPFYLHVPDAAIIKAGLTDFIAAETGSQRISQQNDYLISQERIQSHGLRTYRIDQWMPYKPKLLRHEFSGAKVHIHRRKFHSDPEQLYHKLQLTMGDDAHLFFTEWPGYGAIVLVNRLRSTHQLL